MNVGQYSYEDYLSVVQSFHGCVAPGLAAGGFMVDLALSRIPGGTLFEAVCETKNCLPDAVQLLTSCTAGNGRLKIFNFGRFALSLYDKYNGEGVRVFVDAQKVRAWPEIDAWFFKLKPKGTQDSELLLSKSGKPDPESAAFRPFAYTLGTWASAAGAPSAAASSAENPIRLRMGLSAAHAWGKALILPRMKSFSKGPSTAQPPQDEAACEAPPRDMIARDRNEHESGHIRGKESFAADLQEDRRVTVLSTKENPKQVLKHKTIRLKDNSLAAAENDLAVEELLEIYIDDCPYAITMRLPGDDINLVTGFCFTEGIIASRDDLLAIRHCESIPGERRVLVYLNPNRSNDRSQHAGRRQFLSKSSCGLCGKSQADEIYSDISPVQAFHRVSPGDILTFRQSFEAGQITFQITGSTHAASVFGLRQDLLAFAEDIGRHNALDKAIGALVNEGKTREAYLAIVSSRLSFEMVQKAAVLGVEIFAGLSAPTSLAVEMAERLNITLIGFLREKSMSIYTHSERILDS